MKNLDNFFELIEEKNSFLLIAHLSPDGDAIGAMFAMQHMLVSKSKTVKMVTSSKIPDFFHFFDQVPEVKDDFLLGNFEAIILLDNGDLKRTGFEKRVLNAKEKKIPIVNIDHHIQNDLWKICTINLADEHASSTCEIIYKIYREKNIEITPQVATALLSGLYYDTGGFKHDNATNEVFEIVSFLLHKGGNLKKIAKNISQTKSSAMLKLWGIALNRLKIDDDMALVSTVLTKDDINYCGACEDEISGLVNLLNSATEAKAAMLLYETDDGKIKGSLRTDRSDVDVSALAALFGGGGHKKAAGFVVNGKLTKENGKYFIK